MTRDEYVYNTPPEDIIIDGGIMPVRDLRGDGSWKILRGEDIYFLNEFVRHKHLLVPPVESYGDPLVIRHEPFKNIARFFEGDEFDQKFNGDSVNHQPWLPPDQTTRAEWSGSFHYPILSSSNDGLLSIASASGALGWSIPRNSRSYDFAAGGILDSDSVRRIYRDVRDRKWMIQALSQPDDYRDHLDLSRIGGWTGADPLIYHTLYAKNSTIHTRVGDNKCDNVPSVIISINGDWIGGHRLFVHTDEVDCVFLELSVQAIRCRESFADQMYEYRYSSIRYDGTETTAAVSHYYMALLPSYAVRLSEDGTSLSLRLGSITLDSILSGIGATADNTQDPSFPKTVGYHVTINRIYAITKMPDRFSIPTEWEWPDVDYKNQN